MQSLTHKAGRRAAMTTLGTRVLTEWVITAVVSIMLVLWLSLGQIIQRGDNLYYDTVSQLTAAKPRPDIVIITIDDRSLQAIGAWPWPRSQHAALINRLATANTKAIGYDVLFIEPTTDDATLAQAMVRAGNVYLPAAIDTPGMNGKLSSVSLPAPDIRTAAAGVGHGLLTPDSDGTIRSLPLWVRADGQVLPHLALWVASNNKRLPEPTTEAFERTNSALETLQPRLIHYPDGIAPYPSVSFVDVLRGEVPADFLHNKRVFVGATAQGMGDRYATPTTQDGALLPGVNIVASLAQDILDNRPITRTRGWLAAVASLIPLAVMLVGFLTLRPIANTVLGFSLIVLTLLVSALGLKLGVWWPPLAACAGVIFVWPLWSWRRLAATYTYMRSALNDLRSDDAVRPLSALSPVHDWKSGDEISRQVLSFSSALKQFRDFNRYITQSIHSLPDAALMTDLDGVVLVANRRAHQLFPGKTLEGAHLDDLFNSIGLRDWRGLIDTDNSERDEIQLADGRSIQIAIAALTDTLQKSTGLIVRLADVSHLRAAERERQRTLQLLGHDMRSPQVSILTLLDSANRPANLEDHIRRNARQTLNLAEGYVQLSRAENQMLTFDLVNLADLVTEAADTLWPQSNAKGVELVLPNDGEEYLVEADTALMRRVIINLLDNAIRHTPAGLLIACMLSRLDNKIMLMICDQGSGLSGDMKTRLFQPFAGGNVAGSGLGLAFVHTVIQRHGGQITIEPPHGTSPPFSGACFYIVLPAAEGE